MEDFITVRDRVFKEVKERGLINRIMREVGVSRSTVYNAFAVESDTDVKGAKLDVWYKAVALVQESIDLMKEAKKALGDD